MIPREQTAPRQPALDAALVHESTIGKTVAASTRIHIRTA
jgi:hypothetical protein